MNASTVRAETAQSSETANGAVLQLTDIVKTFPGVKALTDVSLEVRGGEVHALVGENGAGKSTLMAVASGVLEPNAGTVRIGGVELEHADPDEARDLGLGIVRQYPALLPDLTVAENLAIGVGYERVGGFSGVQAWAQEQLDPWEMGIDSRSRIGDLSIEQLFIVEIAKALSLKPKVLILDEPTEHLSAEEIQRLFRRVRSLKEQGTGIVYISHRIPEVKEISDRITVLRDGHIRGTFEADEVDEERIVELVVGRALEAVFPDKDTADPSRSGQFEVVDLSGPGFADVEFSVAAGEIVGIAGVQGNGQEELIRALAGMQPSSGSVRVEGDGVRRGSGPAAARAGIAYIPADRHLEGVFMPLSVGENIVMSTLGRVASGGVVSDRRIREVAHEKIDELGIKTPSSRAAIGNLSGGNQQKAVLARVSLQQPKVILAEEPTQGVDAGARVEIYRILRDAAREGAAVVILSSDGVELEGLCDRVLIMSRGHVVKELAGEEVSEDAITRAALTSTTLRKREPVDVTSRRSFGEWLRGDQAPAAVLGVLVLVIALLIGASNPAYFSSFSLSNLLYMAAPLILIGAAQQIVVLAGGIDLSTGPLMGFLVVLASFFVIDGGSPLIGFALMIGGAIVVGLVNGLLVTRFNLSPVVVTLALALALQGVFLTLRSTPGGSITRDVTSVIQAGIGFVPGALIIAVAVAIGLEVALRRTRWGVELRAVGSDESAATRLGIRVNRVRILSYVITALLVVPAAMLLMAQIGIGDGRPALSFTLSSITVVVLAGTSIFGGRGSFIGVIVAGLLMAQVVGVPAFLGLSGAWGYWLPGAITVVAAVLYAQVRRNRKKA